MGQKMKILIVDDDLSNLSLMKAVLENKGYEVAQATNGEKALKILRSEKINLTISDILMPVMDGYHLCRECKKDENLKTIPFIFCSGTYTDEKDENLSLKFGADAFITKPFHNKDLLATISRVLENMEKGKINVPGQPYTDDDETGVYKLYSERLINKLEEKMLDLDKEKMALEMEVSERKKIEERLRKSRNFAESLFHSAPGIILILDMEGRIVRFNPYMEMVSGYQLKDVEGQYWVDVFAPGNGKNSFKGEFFPRRDGDIARGNISTITAKNGEKRDIMWFDSTLKDEDGKIIGLLAVGQDITHQKTARKTILSTPEEEIENIAEIISRELDEITAAMLDNIARLESQVSDGNEKAKYVKELKKAALRAKELSARLKKQ